MHCSQLPFIITIRCWTLCSDLPIALFSDTQGAKHNCGASVRVGHRNVHSGEFDSVSFLGPTSFQKPSPLIAAWTVQWNCGETQELSGMIRWNIITVAKKLLPTERSECVAKECYEE